MSPSFLVSLNWWEFSLTFFVLNFNERTVFPTYFFPELANFYELLTALSFNNYFPNTGSVFMKAGNDNS